MDISKSAEQTYEEAKKMCERLQELTAKVFGDICEKNVAQAETR